jgi:phosphoenolpyruvate carboxykinase (ATP)
VEIPQECPGVPQEILTPVNTWKDKEAFQKTAADLAQRFTNNFKNFESQVDAEVKNAGPKMQKTTA